MLLATGAACAMASPSLATEQGGVAASITLQTNQVFRGETVSADDPGVTLAVSVDGPAGLFAGAEGSFAAGGKDPRMTANSQHAGIAFRTGSSSSLELGAIHRHYTSIVDPDYNPDYFEGFVGFAYRRTKARFYVSPDYLKDGRASYYAEIETRLLQLGNWSLEGHGGLSMIPQDIGSGKRGLRYYEDWSLSVGREIAGFSFGAGLFSSNYPVIGESGKVRFQASLSKAF